MKSADSRKQKLKGLDSLTLAAILPLSSTLPGKD